MRASSGDTPVPGIGWGMAIDDVELHLRQEFAVHRWDLVGDDDEGDELLARPELLDHSVRILADSLLRVGRARDPGPASRSRLGSALPGSLICSSVSTTPAPTSSSSTRTAPTPTSSVDAAARLLLLWGRRPASARRVRTRLDAADLARLEVILSGF